MPKPNVAVVNGFFESYRNIRINNPSQSKLDNCTKFLAINAKAETVADWVAIIYALSEAARTEHELVTNQWFTWLRKTPLLYRALCAVRSYIISELKKGDSVNEFKIIKDDLWHRWRNVEPEKAEKQALTHKLSDLDELGYLENLNQDEPLIFKTNNLPPWSFTPNYHLYYFENYIRKLDSEALKLEEKSFEHFEKHTQSVRGRELQKMLEAKQPVVQPVLAKEIQPVSKGEQKIENAQPKSQPPTQPIVAPETKSEVAAIKKQDVAAIDQPRVKEHASPETVEKSVAPKAAKLSPLAQTTALAAHSVLRPRAIKSSATRKSSRSSRHRTESTSSVNHPAP